MKLRSRASFLRRVADAGQGLPHVAFAEDFDFPFRVILQAEQAAEQGGLAGAVRPDERRDLSLRHAHVHPAQHRRAAEADAQVADFNGQRRMQADGFHQHYFRC